MSKRFDRLEKLILDENLKFDLKFKILKFEILKFSYVNSNEKHLKATLPEVRVWQKCWEYLRENRGFKTINSLKRFSFLDKITKTKSKYTGEK